MTKKRSGSQPSGQDRRRRVCIVLDALYAGNQRRAARDLRVSQPLLSGITRGTRGVTDRLLEALGRLPGVNPWWAKTGEGEPFVPLTAGTLPVADVILPGPPLENSGLLEGERLPIASAYERDTRYWLRMRRYWSRDIEESLAILLDDIVLVETDREHLGQPDVINGRLCAVRLPMEIGPAESTVALRLALVSLAQDGLSATVLARPVFVPPPQEDDFEHIAAGALAESSPSFQAPRRKHTKKARTEGGSAKNESITSPGPEAVESAVSATPQPRQGQPSAPVPQASATTQPYRIALPGTTSVVGLVLRLERSLANVELNQKYRRAAEALASESKRTPSIDPMARTP